MVRDHLYEDVEEVSKPTSPWTLEGANLMNGMTLVCARNATDTRVSLPPCQLHQLLI